MYIEMFKIYEDETVIKYKFETDIAGDSYIDKNGNKRYHLVTKRGIYIYNKKNNESLFDQEKTDTYFLSRDREKFAMATKLSKSKKDGKYPNSLVIATG